MHAMSVAGSVNRLSHRWHVRQDCIAVSERAWAGVILEEDDDDAAAAAAREGDILPRGSIGWHDNNDREGALQLWCSLVPTPSSSTWSMVHDHDIVMMWCHCFGWWRERRSKSEQREMKRCTLLSATWGTIQNSTKGFLRCYIQRNLYLILKFEIQILKLNRMST